MNARTKESSLSVGDLADLFDPVTGERSVRLMIGSAFASRTSASLTTVLGSCVSICLFDAQTGVGGMNHFMLPANNRDQKQPRDLRFGCDALPWLVQALTDLGARMEKLQAKVFGGGAAMGKQTRIGYTNIEFARVQLGELGIPILAEDVGKTLARQVRFDTGTGRAYVRYLIPDSQSSVLDDESSQIESLGGQ